jgi:pimeloyl-ACP methyl ester carboxylesterase
MATPASADARERSLTAGGIRSRLLETGPEDASEAVVFVHGVPNSADEWKDLMRGTGEFARSIALDMPGFGEADKPRDLAVPVQGFARFLDAALKDLGIERAHLVLHDYGGPWGLAWGVTHTEQWASTVLINTGVLIGFQMHRTGRIWGTPVAGQLMMALTSRSVFSRQLKKSNPGLPAAFVDHTYDQFSRGTRRTILRIYRKRPDDSVLEEAAGAIRPLDVPALVVWGGRDELLPLHHAHQQKEKVFPSAQVVVLEESVHWPFVDDPERAAAAVVPFLRAQVAR